MTTPILIKGRTRYSPHSELFGAQQRARRISCVVVVAHPNDEIVGAGCLISKIEPTSVLHISDGVPAKPIELAGFGTRTEYAEARGHECAKALALANVAEDKIVDWRLPLFESPYQMVELARRLLNFFRKTWPRIVLTHAYEGGHPDHDATAFAVHAAVRILRRNGLKPPMIYEMAIYPSSNGVAKVPEFLFDSARESTTLVLDETSVELKRRMFDCFATQREVLAKTPLGPEKFRAAPVYDFRLPPYFGQLHYERLGWGMTGKEWRSLARQALRTLFPRTLKSPPITPPQPRAISLR